MAYYNWMNNQYGENNGEDPAFSPLTTMQLKAQSDAAAKTPAQTAQDALIKQIMGTSDTSKWSGEGFGSAQANAADMAKILSGIGITDISQFGQLPTYQKLETQYTYNGQPATKNPDGSFSISTLQGYSGDEGTPIYSTQAVPANKVQTQYGTTQTGWSGGEGGDSYSYFTPADPSKVVMQNGQPVMQTGTTYGNKLTGQTVGNTYGERQTGSAFGGTYAGSGNTGYRVQFDAQGNPHFYTTGASSNDLVNMFQDNPILGTAANLAAAYFGGPAAVAALQAAQGKSIEDIAKASALSYVGGQVGGGVSSALSDSLGTTGANILGNVAKQEIASGGKADPLQSLISGSVGAGISAALGNVDAFNDLSPSTQSALSKLASSAIMSGGNLTPAALTSAANSFLSSGGGKTSGPQASDFEAGSMGNYGNMDASTAGFLGKVSDIVAQQQTPSVQTSEKNQYSAPQQDSGANMGDQYNYDDFLNSIGISPNTVSQFPNSDSPSNNDILWNTGYFDDVTGNYSNEGKNYPTTESTQGPGGSPVNASVGFNDRINTGSTSKNSTKSGLGSLGSLTAFIGALGALNSMLNKGGSTVSVPSLAAPTRDTRTIPQWDWNAINAQAAQQGLAPGQFVARNLPQAMSGELNAAAPVAKARGGILSRLAEGGGSGRDDTIPARLSDGEYVMDAETVSLLGDGSTKDGARRLDEMRAKIREHKGKSMARGKFSANAKSPLAYLKEAN